MLHKYKDIKVVHFKHFEILRAQDKFPDAPKFLVDRLAKANIRRRQMLEYNQRHHLKIMGKARQEHASPSQSVTQKMEEEVTEAFLLLQQPLMNEYPVTVMTGRTSALNSHTTLPTIVEQAGAGKANCETLPSVEAELEAEPSETSYAVSSTAGSVSRLCIPSSPRIRMAPRSIPLTVFSLLHPRTILLGREYLLLSKP